MCIVCVLETVRVLNTCCYLAGSVKLIQISLTGTRWRYATVMVHPLLVTQKVRLGLLYLCNFETIGVYLWFCVLHIQIRNSYYIWVYIDVSFFFLNKKQLLYTTERKWVVLQRTDHMGNYYEWNLIDWHVKSKAGYTFTVIHHIIFFPDNFITTSSTSTKYIAS